MWSCDNITCANNFLCNHNTEDEYPFCNCSQEYTEYNCSTYVRPIDDKPGERVVSLVNGVLRFLYIETDTFLYLETCDRLFLSVSVFKIWNRRFAVFIYKN